LTYAVLSTVAGLDLLGLLLGRRLRVFLWLGLFGRLGLRLLLGRFRLRLLLLGLRLLGLLLLARRLRRSLLFLGSGLLDVVLCLLLSTGRRLTTKLKPDNILSNGNSVLLVDEELLDGTSLGCVQGNVDLVGLDGSNFLVLLNVVADLCMPLVPRRRCCAVVFLTLVPLLQCTLGNRLGHLGDLDGGNIG
jgi:hypothetical protein